MNIDRLRNIKNDVEFTQRLLSEKSVFCLPAKVSDEEDDEDHILTRRNSR